MRLENCSSEAELLPTEGIASRLGIAQVQPIAISLRAPDAEPVATV